MGIAERWKGHPPLPSDLEDRIPRLVDRLRRAGAGLVYIFGSAAEDADPARRDPEDLDLGVWGLEEDRWIVGADLARILETDRLDLVPMEQADPELRYRIIADGRLLYARDPEMENQIEMSILREYQDLAPFRRIQAAYLRDRHRDRGS